MNNRLGSVTATMWAAAVAVSIGAAVNQETTRDQADPQAVQDAVINFGALPPPLAPPAPPPPPASHVLVPNHVAIFKGGTVTFIMNGPGHGVAIYRVSKNTTRAHIEEQLCQGGSAACGAAMAARQPYQIRDGHGDLVIEIGPNPPENRIDYAPGQLGSAGAGQFLIGSATTATGSITPGTEMRYRFPDKGRYLVVCMNRPHTINDWMFGFVDVV